jgi:hypothetical protein
VKGGVGNSHIPNLAGCATTAGRGAAQLKKPVVVDMASDGLERDLTKASVGFLSQEDYKRKREVIEEDKAMSALKRIAAAADGGGSSAAGGGGGGGGGGASSEPPSEGKKKKDKKKEKGRKPAALSFEEELEEEAFASSPGAVVRGGMAAARAKGEQQKLLDQEAAMREVLMQQRKAKQEPLTLQYTFRSELTQRELPSGTHKGSVTIKRGFTADEAAVAVRADVETLGGKFAPNAVQGIREERDVILVCCCEGMDKGSFVVPGAVSLVELWTRRWADQPLPLFDEFKHGVVVSERRWFEQQRHTYPYSQWRTCAHTRRTLGRTRPAAESARGGVERPSRCAPMAVRARVHALMSAFVLACPSLALADDSRSEYSLKEFVATRGEVVYKFEARRESQTGKKK